MNKYLRIAYWIFTALFCALMLYSANMYLSNYEMVNGFFVNLGYPTYLIYPLAILKIIGVITILTNFNKTLKEWAYAAFFFEIILAFFAHYMIKDGGQKTALIAMILLLTSYFLYKKTRK
ncbi:membrane protein [Flavobacterium sp. 316]|uniref:DoxX family protein n=1 Tax=Flavobacterium sediminilitoris TaxID=2024526 RepID=A0ABY4HR15_9FLAO|nr:MULTISPECIES: DoxX family protein [Flavobacterium]KIX20757.1 membrane protein [Flavobacterium sp. 316]UOX34666.1 DoxX family protein [Flavobacterium sediminilitoris]